MIKKKCENCNITKPISCFRKNKSRKDGYHNWCDKCHKEYLKTYNRKNKDKIKARHRAKYLKNKDVILKKAKEYRDKNKARLQKRQKEWYQKIKRYYPEKYKKLVKKSRAQQIQAKYGVTPERYELFRVNQNYKCAGCDKSETEVKLEVDHCHKDGFARGLLCGGCNKALGQVKDSIKTLKKLIDYLFNAHEYDGDLYK